MFQQVTRMAEMEPIPISMGRPPLPKDERRSERTVTFLTLEERVELVQQAAAASQSLSAYCHRLIADGLQDQANSNKDIKL
jgi:hypothetical protein